MTYLHVWRPLLLPGAVVGPVVVSGVAALPTRPLYVDTSHRRRWVTDAQHWCSRRMGRTPPDMGHYALDGQHRAAEDVQITQLSRHVGQGSNVVGVLGKAGRGP